MSISTLMTTNETLIDGREYFISDTVYLIIDDYDVRWFERKKREDRPGFFRGNVMQMNTYPNNPRMFISLLSWRTNTRSSTDPNAFVKEYHEYLNLEVMNGK